MAVGNVAEADCVLLKQADPCPGLTFKKAGPFTVVMMTA
jgi:hypothetical protein